ncbi:sugar phosphate isomerase/epimerase family protein [Bremerella sp.]|uniref:sugar phosphate isomerase/epimerase family protein n=1 Tax=Bremerella sp. TaxID=2795602 RepID=UPI003919C406
MTSIEPPPCTRRKALQLLAGSAAAAVHGLSRTTVAHAEGNVPAASQFQIACMTLPYSRFPLQRALQGIKSAGYEHVAWGTTHVEGTDSKQTPVLAKDASPQTAARLGQQCRDMGLNPVMMFSMVYPEHDDGLEVLTQRIRQASAAEIGQVLTFGHTEGGSRKLWVERFTKLGPIARDHGVTLVVKQHGGSTGTGEACADIIREVNDPGVRVNYDAGNVMDYLNVDPIPDIQKCADVVHSFCIKDHRNWPVDQDCGPGLGEIDHYRLLSPVARLGRTIPLCCENIFPPILQRPDRPEEIDAYAQRARVFLETVVAGLHQVNES